MVDTWLLASASEERLLLHQFLRFDETSAVAQHLILQQALQMLSAVNAVTRPVAPGGVDYHQPPIGLLGALQVRQTRPFASFHGRSASLLNSYGWFFPRDEKDVHQDELPASTGQVRRDEGCVEPVSYTHLTLPTIYSV